MNLFKCRRHAGAFLFTLFSAVVALSSCGAGSGSAGRRMAEGLSAHRIPAEPGQGTLYEITQPVLEETGGDLCCLGMYDESRLLILLADRSGDAVTGYTARLLDLESGETRTLLSFKRQSAPGYNSDGTEDLTLISGDPLILHDKGAGILYMPDLPAGSVVLPEYLKDAVPCRMGDRLWLSGDRGMIYEITGQGELRTAWSLPCEYGAFTPLICGHDGRLSFATCSRRDPSLTVYVDVDPSAGESEYYLSDINPSRFTAFRDGLLLGSSFRTRPAVSICDPGRLVKKELELPDEILTLLETDSSSLAEGGDSFLAFSTFPLSLSRDRCCFALCDSGGRPVHIYLWDTADCRPVKWTAPSLSAYTAPQTHDYGALTKEAARLQEKYGVRIVLGSNVPAEFSDYSAQPCTDEKAISGSLAVLENVLSLYPENYFKALKGGYYRDIVFYLTGALQPLDAGENISNAGAFATESGGTMQLAFDLYDDLRPDTVIHELTHAADYRFAGEGLWDEEAWNRLNPEGFSYYYSYIDENGRSYETAGSLDGTAVSGCPAEDVWFIDPYSKTYPMEDRARLMENLLMQSLLEDTSSPRTPYADCFSSPHLQEKLSFYFRFLRQTLDDGSWPAQTTWEKALAHAAAEAVIRPQ